LKAYTSGSQPEGIPQVGNSPRLVTTGIRWNKVWVIK